jgi:hypothetical protein
VTLEELDRWLDVYGRAWERKDVDAFVACFAEDAVYAWGPWVEPLQGHGEIRTATERAIATQEDIKFGHEPLAITPDGRGDRWRVSTPVPGGTAARNQPELVGCRCEDLQPARRPAVGSHRGTRGLAD